MEIEILKENFSYMVKKNDVWIVYCKDRKFYVCNKNSVEFKKDTIKLVLHKKED